MLEGFGWAILRARPHRRKFPFLSLWIKVWQRDVNPKPELWAAAYLQQYVVTRNTSPSCCLFGFIHLNVGFLIRIIHHILARLDLATNLSRINLREVLKIGFTSSRKLGEQILLSLLLPILLFRCPCESCHSHLKSMTYLSYLVLPATVFELL